MIEIQIAGAGAGKTYDLSKRVIQFHQANTSHKIIYAVTYTNAARKKIKEEIVKGIGYIPDQVRIETIHSFFLNEIIYPYSHFSVSEVYNNAVSHGMPSDYVLKNIKINLLKQRNIIHNESVFKKAMIVIDRTNGKHTNKAKRAKVDFIVSHIVAKISHVFIDEAQDMDGDALRVFQILGDNGIDIYMIGDPKQAIKYPSAFRNFLKQATGDNYTILPNNNITKRVPSEILKLSNALCMAEEKQSNNNGKSGKVVYIKSSNSNYDAIIGYYKAQQQLIYIEEKEGCYNTHSSRNLYLPLSLQDKLSILALERDLDSRLFINSIISEITERLKNSSSAQVLGWLAKFCGTRLEKQEYAELIQHLDMAKMPSKGYKYFISSIDAVKGLESDVCIFILNQTMYDYMTQNVPKTNYHNKNWNKVYVALTRSCNALIIAIDMELFSRTSVTEIESYFKGLGISEMLSV
ncbi:UvrD-helicase domain-containing protein [Flavobacterium sp. DGU11]|uniref:UvrD-helicase domain-containing protein n=1 Tax=Flavobacterium arundinis TaxID=3139143 RepID=A0ABU9I1K0_9FLAO